ncbi:MAG: hypothetical protein M1830_003135 [Pleopsidium flavum]|nr:MAG: hypothetical protein M1830_003135 [Pleopsidium flavum]
MIPRLVARRVMVIRSLRGSTKLSSKHPIEVFAPQRSKPTLQTRHFAVRTEADSKLEELQELYATAKDEFEIACEETEKKTVYAADDRAAAQEELAKLKKAFNDAVEKSSPDVSTEIKNRVGQRIRELDRAVEAMEQAALEE